MSEPQPTLDTSWVKLFSFMKEEEITEDRTQSVFQDGSVWCRICEQTLDRRARATHAEHHRKEYHLWRTQRQSEAQDKNTQRLKEVTRLQKEGKFVPKSKLPVKQAKTAKDQGFPEVYLAPNGNFKPGGDSQAKSDLVNIALGKQVERIKLTPAEALKLIEVRGWEGYLERKKRIERESS